MFEQPSSRRAFLSLAGAGGLVGLARPAFAWATEGGHAHLVVHNAKVYTVDDTMPRAEAFAIRAGRFVAVGSSADMRTLAGPRTRVIDAGGATIVPGFIDCHNHATGEVLLYDVLVGNPFEVEFVSIQSIVDKLRARAAQTPPGTWVSGYFHDDTKLTDKRQLTAADLDRVSTVHPVVVRHRGGHTSFYNHKALEMAKVTEATVPRPAARSKRGRTGSSAAG